MNVGAAVQLCAGGAVLHAADAAPDGQLAAALEAAHKEREVLEAKVRRLQAALSRASKGEMTAKAACADVVAQATEATKHAIKTAEQMAESAELAATQKLSIANAEARGKANATEYRISSLQDKLQTAEFTAVDLQTQMDVKVEARLQATAEKHLQEQRDLQQKFQALEQTLETTKQEMEQALIDAEEKTCLTLSAVLEQVAWEQSQHGSKSDQRCDILEAQNAVLRKQLEAQGDGDRLVDKRLVASLLVSYLSVDTDADKKREILQVASNLLGLTEEEQMSVGLGGGMPTQDANLFGLKMPSWVFGGGDRGQAAPQHTQHPQQSYEPV
jgi:hypothetical protein